MSNAVIIPGTTPILPLLLPAGTDISEAVEIDVTLASESAEVNKKGAAVQLIDGRKIRVQLTQAESLLFPDFSTVKVQINWVFADGNRGAAGPAVITMGEQMLREVIPGAG